MAYVGVDGGFDEGAMAAAAAVLMMVFLAVMVGVEGDRWLMVVVVLIMATRRLLT